MDQQLEQQVVRGLARLPKDASLVIASHRPALLALCDRVIVLDRGEIKADGAARNQDGKKEAPRASRVTLRKGGTS